MLRVKDTEGISGKINPGGSQYSDQGRMPRSRYYNIM